MPAAASSRTAAQIELAEFKLRAGGAEIALSGSLVTGSQPASTRLEGTLEPNAAQHAEGAVAEGHRARAPANGWASA